VLRLVAAALAAYIAGSIPFGYMAGRLRGIDLRTVGSGNVGTTNVYRALGGRMAILIFVLDAAKGLVGARLIPLLAGADAAPAYLGLVCGIAVILGSVGSIFMGFRGGKGVATAVGVFLGLEPLATAICLGLWALLVASTRYVSVGSIAGAVALPILIAVIRGGQAARASSLYLALSVSAIVIVRHRSNIRRLIDGSENKIKRLEVTSK
jgi:glycerol-3-phosphate acyltransferase PlsY